MARYDRGGRGSGWLRSGSGVVPEAPAAPAYGAAPTQDGSGKAARRSYSGAITDYYGGMEKYARKGGDMTGLNAPVQPYGGKRYRQGQADAMTAWEAAQKAGRGYNRDQRYIARGGKNTETHGNITRGGSHPVGGSIRPMQQYTAHTGYEMNEDGTSTPTGGGEAIKMGKIPKAERIAARPDLQSSQPVQQLATTATPKRVNSIANQMAQANALRGGV
jgi:hypothetical protein